VTGRDIYTLRASLSRQRQPVVQTADGLSCVEVVLIWISGLLLADLWTEVLTVCEAQTRR